MQPITISVPTYLKYGVRKPKTFALNLNIYRNTHFQTLNQMKVLFEERIKPIIASLPRMSKVKLTYSLFFGSNRSVDTSNVCCIVDKFFSDCLVNAGKLIDDNISIISEVCYRFGGVDTKNPRCEITLSDYEVIDEKEEDMRITIVQAEIELAIKQYILTQITVKEGQTINIDFKATRGEDGATAEINIGAAGNEPQKPVQSVQTRTAPTTAQTTPKASTASPAPSVAATQPTTTQAEPSVTNASTTTVATEVASTEPKEEEEFTPPASLKGNMEYKGPETEAPAPQTSKSLFSGLAK